jgi:hypothetical protein
MSEDDPNAIAILPLGDIDIEAKCFTLTGRVADTWAQFEFHIDRTIWQLASLNDAAGACLTAQFIGVHPRFRALSSLMRLHGVQDGELTKELASIEGTSQSIADDRNRMIHDPWMYQVTNDRSIPTKHGKLRITAKKKLDFSFIPVTDGQIESLLAKIKSHTKRFHRFAELLRAELGKL